MNLSAPFILRGLLTLALTSSVAEAAILVSENFNYPTGAVGGVGATGTGVTGPWTAGAQGGASTAASSFVAGSLTIPGHFSASGGSLQLINNGPDYGEGGAAVNLNFAVPAVTTLWASSIIQVASPGGSYFDDWVVEVRMNTTASSGYTSSIGRILGRAYGSGTGAAGKGGIGSNSSEVTQGTGSVAPDTNYLFVTRYAMNLTGVDSATLYAFSPANYSSYLSAANANPGNAESLLAANASFSLTDTDDGGLAGITVLQYTINGGPIGRYDDFRLGTALTDVVNVVPESGPVLLSGLGLAGVFLNRRRAKK